MRIERDPLGEHAVPDDAYYGIQTVRAVENFPISGLRAPAELVTATVLVKKAAAQANVALDASRPARGRGDRAGGGRDSERRARRPVHRRCLPGRRRHLAQHERERGARQSRVGDPRRREGRVSARAPERPRQHGTVHQRRVPDGDAAGAAAGARRAGRGRARAGGVIRSQGRRVRIGTQGRSHAPAGRCADHARTGVRRLRRMHRARRPTMSCERQKD